ncbi:hypothetical protein [Mycobacterium leprae]|nr:hypothetical protein [Mycobacterium leprae]
MLGRYTAHSGWTPSFPEDELVITAVTPSGVGEQSAITGVC